MCDETLRKLQAENAANETPTYRIKQNTKGNYYVVNNHNKREMPPNTPIFYIKRDAERWIEELKKRDKG